MCKCVCLFQELGTPSEEIWTGYNELPVVKKVTFTKQPYNNLRKRFPYLTQSGFDLLNKFLTYDPKRRITGEKALEDPYFKVYTCMSLKGRRRFICRVH